MTNILLIEDNRDFREDLLELLQLEGYFTLAAENGQSGLQMLREYSPSLVICDIDMPLMNGLEVVRNVKADPLLAMIPILILTAISDRQMEENLHRLGVTALLRKPINIVELLSVITHVLQQNTSSV